MKSLLMGTLCFVSAVSAQANVAFYVNAHADDAALFMGQSLAHDIKATLDTGHRTILITTTAGDAGAGTGNSLGVAPNYLARELGHSNVLQFLWGRTGANNAQFSSEMVNIAGKSVYRAQMSSTQNGGYVAWYNIRLPDGNLEGEGYESTGSQSLLKLENGTIRKISAIDHSASYSRKELLRLFQNIVIKEGQGLSRIWANLPDQNSSGTNADDHADHQVTSRLFTEALNEQRLKCVGRTSYSTYVNASKPINMNTDDLWVHIAMWGTLNQGLSAGGQLSTWEPGPNHWLGREYKTHTVQASNNCNL